MRIRSLTLITTRGTPCTLFIQYYYSCWIKYLRSWLTKARFAHNIKWTLNRSIRNRIYICWGEYSTFSVGQFYCAWTFTTFINYFATSSTAKETTACKKLWWIKNFAFWRLKSIKLKWSLCWRVNWCYWTLGIYKCY